MTIIHLVATPDESPPEIERIPLKAIIAACVRRTGVSYDEMCSRHRDADLVEARRLTWVCIRRLRPDFHSPRTGEWFNRDPSTIRVGIKRWVGTQSDIDGIAMVARKLVAAADSRSNGNNQAVERKLGLGQ